MKKYYFYYFFTIRKNDKPKSKSSIYDFLENFENDINADEVSEKEAIAKVCKAFANEIRRCDNKAIIDADKGCVAVFDKKQLNKPIGYYFVGVDGLE